MIQFRNKNFTLQEGRYNGPKFIEDVPGTLEMLSKGTVGGAIVGGIIGHIVDKEVVEGAKNGGKVGFVSGLLAKVLLNYLHNPMSSVKYQEVDKNIRKEFGIRNVKGFIFNDSLDNRSKLDERFSFNDRFVTRYKINFVVADNKIIMYTFCLNSEELDKVNNHIDYYCQKYRGMNYISTLINSSHNSYSVAITFTNYSAINSFIIELSQLLNTKINILDNKTLAINKITTFGYQQKDFSEVKDFNLSDVAKIFFKSGLSIFFNRFDRNLNIKDSISLGVLTGINSALEKLGKDNLVKSGAPVPSSDLGNKFLLDTLRRLRYQEGFHFTIGDNTSKINVSLTSGRLLITAPNKTQEQEELDKFYEKTKRCLFRNLVNKNRVVVYSHTIKSKPEFEGILRNLVSTGITFNIFDK